MRLALKKSAMKAALICAAVKDMRPYLNGVNIRFVPGKDGGQLVFASTTGSILFAGTTPADWDEGEQTAGFDITIPSETVKAALKGRLPVALLSSLPDGRYSLADVIFAPLEGKYPDYERVIPTACDGQVAQFDPELLTKAQDALRAYYDSPRMVTTLHHNGPGCAAVSGNGPDAVVTVMPWKAGGDYAGFAMPRTPAKLKAAA